MLKLTALSIFLFMAIVSCDESKKSNTFVNVYEPPPPGTIPPDSTRPDTSGNNSDTTITDPEQIYITDQTGKKWNITHAIDKYGFEVSRFQFGLGPYAIQPINDPVFIERDENGYPSSSNTMQIIGTTIMGESRAYPLETLYRHEILNDAFGDVHVAVGF